MKTNYNHKSMSHSGRFDFQIDEIIDEKKRLRNDKKDTYSNPRSDR